MKKLAPVLALIGVVLLVVVLFSLSRGTVQAPEAQEGQATTTEASSTPPGVTSPVGVGLPASVKKVMKVYTNPSWDLRLRYDPEWQLVQNADVVNISSVSAYFMISKEQPIAEPARLTEVQTKRTILGEEVAVTRFEKPNDSYAFYEYFVLRVDGTEYYVKVLSLIDPNPKVDEFLANITVQ